MRFLKVIEVLSCAAIFVALGHVAPAQEPDNEPTSEAAAETAAQQTEIARLIGQLDADAFETRERATQALREMGLPAIPALQAAKNHTSAEVRYRAKSLIEQMTSGIRLHELAQFCTQPDEKLDLEHGMWLISRILDPQVKKNDLTRPLNKLATGVRKELGKKKKDDPGQLEPAQAVEALRQALFVEEGFTGNVDDYNNPDNSSLARVLETKKGLPIILSHVTIAVAKRVGIPIVGVPASGRYLVKYDGSRAPGGPTEDIYFSPFEAGRVLTADEKPDDVPTYTNRDTIMRMLRNLHSHLLETDDPPTRDDELQQVQELLNLLEIYHQPATP